MNGPARRLFNIAAVALLASGALTIGRAQTPALFAARIAQLSEPGGYFDTDNLISNEKSYLHVIPALHDGGVTGGAYIGVGPDQNFSYIAQIRPAIAFIVDIRRDNLLLHLLFKAMFSLADTRVDYLSLLFGRPPPPGLDEWRKADIDRIAAYIDSARTTPAAAAAIRAKIDATIKTFGVPLSAEDVATIDRFHQTFVNGGLPLKFETTGRGPRSYYPSYRDLLFETDRQGHRWNYLVSEDDFQFVRSLERRDLVIPVVGDLAGPKALAQIGKMMTDRDDRLSAFYASNVEFYLASDHTFQKFVDNLSRLPHTNKSVIIRSIFSGANALPYNVPGYASASIVQSVDELLQGYAAGRFHNYRELIISR
jgi:hypothetical protein